MTILADVYAREARDRCREHGCSVVLPKSVAIYCGEGVRDKTYGTSQPEKTPVCDCIVVDPAEKKISLIELKRHAGKKKWDRPEHIRDQFRGSVKLLFDILDLTRQSDIRLQLVLCTNGKFRNASEHLAFSRPLEGSAPRLRIVRQKCGCPLPDSHHRVHAPAV